MLSWTLTYSQQATGLSWGIYFFAYNRAKERYQRMLQQTKLSPQLHLLSAAEAGSLVSRVGGCAVDANEQWFEAAVRRAVQHAVRSRHGNIAGKSAECDVCIHIGVTISGLLHHKPNLGYQDPVGATAGVSVAQHTARCSSPDEQNAGSCCSSRQPQLSCGGCRRGHPRRISGTRRRPRGSGSRASDPGGGCRAARHACTVSKHGARCAGDCARGGLPRILPRPHTVAAAGESVGPPW